MSLVEPNEKSGKKVDLAPMVAISSEPLMTRWFAVYTMPRHEKRVAEHFAQRQIESFLPVYHTQRRWKDGSKVNLRLPLFPNYIFAHFAWQRRVRVLEVPGVLSVVGTTPEAAALPEDVIDALRVGLLLHNPEPHPYLVVGQRARIRTGPLSGLEGVIVRRKNSVRVVLTLEQIMQSVAVEVHADDLEPLS